MNRCFVILLCLVLPASLALADGDAPTRKMNASEAAAFGELQGTIRAALPKTPANYSAKFTGFDRKETYEAIGPDGMLGMNFSGVYSLSKEYAAAQEQAALKDMAKGPADQEAKHAALNAREQELTRVRDDRSRSRAERDKARAELKAVRAELSALDEQAGARYLAKLQGGGMAETMRKAQSQLPANELSIRVTVNRDVSVHEVATPYEIPGVPVAFEQSDQCENRDNYCITVLLGPFEKAKGSGPWSSYKVRRADLGVPTKARGMALVFDGRKDKPEAVRDFVRKTDFRKLSGLVP